jgi:hypothetical protein
VRQHREARGDASQPGRAGATAAHVVLGRDLEEGHAAVGPPGIDLGGEAGTKAEADPGRRICWALEHVA